MQFDDTSQYKLVALLNKRLEVGVAMNALAHAVAGAVNLAGDAGRQTLKFLDFEDADGQLYPSISARSFIILRATSADIRKVSAKASDAGLLKVCFTEPMTGGTYTEQLDRSRKVPRAELEFYALVLLGPIDLVQPITRKYSLWRTQSAEG